MPHLVLHVVNVTLLAIATIYLNRRRLCDRACWTWVGRWIGKFTGGAFICAVCLEVAIRASAFTWWWFC